MVTHVNVPKGQHVLQNSVHVGKQIRPVAQFVMEVIRENVKSEKYILIFIKYLFYVD